MVQRLMQHAANLLAPDDSRVTWLEAKQGGDLTDLLTEVSRAIEAGSAQPDKTHYVIIAQRAVEAAGQGKSKPKPKPQPPQFPPNGH